MSLDTVPESRGDALDSVWCFASSARVTLALIALLAATLALAVVLPQLPAGLDSAAADRWLGAAAAGYRGLGTILRAVGAYDILHGLWLRILLAFLAYNLALRLTDQLRRMRRAWRTVALPPPFPPDLPMEHVSLSGTLEAALGAAQEAMRPRYPALASATDAGQASIYGRRRRAGVLGAPVLSLGLLLLLAGLAVNGDAGWRTADIALAVNGSTGLSVGGGLQLLLDRIEEEGRATKSTVTVTRSDGQQESLTAGYMLPARSGNLWIVQRATGPALQARARSADRALLLQSLAADGQANANLNLPFREMSELAFAIPGRNLAFRVVSYNALPEQGIQGPVFLIEAYRGDNATPFLTQLVENAATLSVEDITIDLRRERYAELVAAYLPGLGAIVLGLLLVFVGTVLLLVWGYTETWGNLIVTDLGVMAVFRTAAPVRARAECARLGRATLAASSSADAEPNSAGGQQHETDNDRRSRRDRLR
jgi:hypothetical protein